MKTTIIFFSKTGFTKKYVDWLAQEIECDVLSVRQAKKGNVQYYDRIVFASWIRAGSIQKLKFFKKLHFYGEKIVLVTGASPESDSSIMVTLANNFRGELEKFKTFYLQGGLSYPRMGLRDKVMMMTLCFLLRLSRGKGCDAYRTICCSFDATSKGALTPLLDYLDG